MASLILEDGTRFAGQLFGAECAAAGEVVFATDMLGYQLLLTDPVYRGKIVCMTYPLIGNVGICEEDMASPAVQVAGLVVQTLCDHPSNWLCKQDLASFLAEQGIPALQGVDTRALARHLRATGVQRGFLCAQEPATEPAPIREPSAEPDWVAQTTCAAPYTVGEDGLRVALLDLGADRALARALAARACRVTVYPAHTPADALLADGCQAAVFSGGPGDPHAQRALLPAIAAVMEAVPTLGIGLGYELMILAQGGKVLRLPYGHHGNQPVREVETGLCDQTAQRHLYAADPDALPAGARATYLNVNDGTIAGLTFAQADASGVQFHPAAEPGPRGTGRILDAFVRQARARRAAE